MGVRGRDGAKIEFVVDVLRELVETSGALCKRLVSLSLPVLFPSAFNTRLNFPRLFTLILYTSCYYFNPCFTGKLRFHWKINLIFNCISEP